MEYKQRDLLINKYVLMEKVRFWNNQLISKNISKNVGIFLYLSSF